MVRTITITLPDDLAQKLTQQAEQLQISVEELVLRILILSVQIDAQAVLSQAMNDQR
jgi:hypothetical protein